MFGSKTKEIKRLTAENQGLRADLEYARNEWTKSEQYANKAIAGHEETKNLLTEAKGFLDQFEEESEKLDDANEALNAENQDMHEEIRYLSGMVGLYESVLASLRVPVKLPARKK